MLSTSSEDARHARRGARRKATRDNALDEERLEYVTEGTVAMAREATAAMLTGSAREGPGEGREGEFASRYVYEP